MTADDGLTGPAEPGGPCPCEEAISHVWDLLDGEIDYGECQRIEAHLAECGGCRSEYEREAALKRLVARACSCDEAPPALRQWVERRVAIWRTTAGADGATSSTYVEIRRGYREQ